MARYGTGPRGALAVPDVTDASRTGESLLVSLDVSAVPARPGGAGYYTMAIARGLDRRNDVAASLVARRGDEQRWHALAGRATVRGAVPASRPGRLVFEQLRLGSVLRSMGVEVHHGPHYTMPSRSPVPCVVTIHDCTFFDHPEWHVRSKAAFFRRAIRRAARQAAVVICVSRVTEDRLRAWCDVRAQVVVAPHGVDHRRFTPLEPAGGADRALLSSLGVPVDRPLVAFVGTLEPRKGVAPLVAAFDQVARRHPDAVLVLGGQAGWGMAETERALAAARHPERIVRTGYLPDEAVPALLRQAAVVAYPALEEGFGLPALEALACGAPLVTTEGTAMAEMAGGAALLVPPGDVTGLADALGTALQEGRATARRVLGIEVAGERTWEASVALHRHAYALALATPQ
jgi:glycosyltransferase involved in cell wall biosynthesis